MTTEADEVQRLIRKTWHSLAPAAVPPHRALDVFFLSGPSQPDWTAFCDAFWAEPGRFAACAIRIGGGDAGRLGAHAFKAVLRAALRRHPADRALALSSQALAAYGPAIPIDAAVATIAARDGTATLGTLGSGAACRLDAGSSIATNGTPGMRLGRGAALRLFVGPVTLASPSQTVPVGAAELVRALVGEAPGSAALAIVFKDYAERRAGTFVLANDVDEISPRLAEIGAYLQAHGVPANAWTGLEVALDELLTNIVLHGYGDGGAHEVLIDAQARNGVLRVEIRDDGVPFDPTSVPPPDLKAGMDERPIGGLGLHLARTIVDAVRYRRVRGWNVVTLMKALAGAPV